MKDFIKKNWFKLAIVLLLVINPILTANIVNIVSPGITKKTTDVISFAVGGAIDKRLNPIKEKLDICYTWSTSEMIRFIEKQYQKSINNPDDFYQSDFSYFVDFVVQILPDDLINPTLQMKIDFMNNLYNQKINIEVLK